MIGTYAPRNCGIATFTADLCEQLLTHFPDLGVDVYALEAEGSRLTYADKISVISAQEVQGYAKAARAINRSGVDVVWIQHELGIFGGEDGRLISELVDGIAAPLVVTFHPVLAARESESYRAMLEDLAERLGVASSIEWDNRFLAIDELLGQLEGCDIYVTPYRSLGQTTSGTLSDAVALGKTVVSTPYVHARGFLALPPLRPARPAALGNLRRRYRATPPKDLQPDPLGWRG